VKIVHALAASLCFPMIAGAGRAEEALRVCLDENAPPYSVHRKGGDSGFDLAVARAVAAQLGRELTVQWFESKLDEDSSGPMEANALLSDGRCQIVGGYPLTEDSLAKPGAPTARLPDFEGATRADRRRRIPTQAMLASKAYHFAALTVVLGGAAVGRSISAIGDLDGVKIGVEGGTLSDTILMSWGGGKLIDGVTHMLPGRGELWPAMERGEFEATLVPLHRFDAYRAAHPDTKLRGSGYLYPVGFNFGFLGLARDAALLAKIDVALEAKLASGEIAALAPAAGMTYLPPRPPDVRKAVALGDLRAP
jgi:ABC-type amino acid transport substrate-binding protein